MFYISHIIIIILSSSNFKKVYSTEYILIYSHYTYIRAKCLQIFSHLILIKRIIDHPSNKVCQSSISLYFYHSTKILRSIFLMK